MKSVLLFESYNHLNDTVSENGKIKIKALGKAICLVRTVMGLIAFYDECPHMSDSLSAGHLNRNQEIVCPWHSYRFDIYTGEEVENRCKKLEILEIRREGEKFFLMLPDS